MISFGKKSSYLPHHPAINVYCDLEYITDPLTCTGNAEGIAKAIPVFGGKLNIKLILDYIKLTPDFAT